MTGKPPTNQADLVRQLVGAAGAPPSIDISRYLHLLRRNLWLIAVIVVAGVFATWTWLGRQPKIYASTATIEVESTEQKVVKFADFQQQDLQSEKFLNTIVQNFTSEEILARAVRAAGLDRDPIFIHPAADGSPPTSATLAGRIFNSVHAGLRGETNLIDVTVEDTDPVRSSQLATALVKEFVRLSYEQRAEAGKGATDFLQAETARLKTKLEESEQRLQSYREEHPTVSFGEAQTAVSAKLSDLTRRVTDARAERLRLESDLGLLKTLDFKDPQQLLRVPSIAEDPQVTAALKEANDAQANYLSLKARYQPGYPKLDDARNWAAQSAQSLAATIATVAKTISQRYDAVQETEAKLQSLLDGLQKNSLELDRLSIRYNVLSREVESDRALFDSVITQQKETSVAQGIDRVPYRIVGLPGISSVPIKPQPVKILAVGFGFSLMVGIGLIFLLDFTNSTFRSVDEAESTLHLPTLASVPDGDLGKGAIVLLNDTNSLAAEAFRTLRASLALDAAAPKVILVTSAIPGEGKSFTAMNIAAALAHQGLRTVLIEGDVRLPVIEKQLIGTSPNRSAGLVDCLLTRRPAAENLLPTSMPDLWLLPAGRRVQNPSEMLSHVALGELVHTLRQDYDRVVIDAPPVNAVSDPLLIARHVDGICLVIRAGKTPRRAVQRAVNMLAKTGMHMAGFVLNRVPLRAGDHSYYYYSDKYIDAAS